MKTKVFFSFSGNMSRDIAKVFVKWLPKVLQFVDPYLSEDMEKGAKWFENVAKGLKDAKVGLIFLTPENLESTWIMFEAGALSNAVGKSYVCPILFNLKKRDVIGPLSKFQLTEFKNEDMKILIKTINNQGGELELPETMRDEIFNSFWQKELKDKIDQVLQDPKYKDVKPDTRNDGEILEEILELTRSLSREQTDSALDGEIESFTIPNEPLPDQKSQAVVKFKDGRIYHFPVSESDVKTFSTPKVGDELVESIKTLLIKKMPLKKK